MGALSTFQGGLKGLLEGLIQASLFTGLVSFIDGLEDSLELGLFFLVSLGRCMGLSLAVVL